jgi:hypothetical protein
VSLALNLIPFAGVAFLWFLGVLRDRLGEKEDQFFATVFLGSGLLFLGMIFVSASAMGGLIHTYSVATGALVGSRSFSFGRAFAFCRHADLRIQDGCGFYDLYVYASHKDPACRTFDCLSVIRVCSVPSYWQRLS